MLRESAKAMPLLVPEAVRLEEVLRALDAWQVEAKQAVLRKSTSKQLQELLLTAASLPVHLPQVASLQVCAAGAHLIAVHHVHHIKTAVHHRPHIKRQHIICTTSNCSTSSAPHQTAIHYLHHIKLQFIICITSYCCTSSALHQTAAHCCPHIKLQLKISTFHLPAEFQVMLEKADEWQAAVDAALKVRLRCWDLANLGYL